MESLLAIIYLVASVTFIVGMKMLGSPATARRGNLVAAAGMGLAILGTITLYTNSNGEHLRWLGHRHRDWLDDGHQGQDDVDATNGIVL
jgi:NAD/NADP transhydrogenase beta subunit